MQFCDSNGNSHNLIHIVHSPAHPVETEREDTIVKALISQIVDLIISCLSKRHRATALIVSAYTHPAIPIDSFMQWCSIFMQNHFYTLPYLLQQHSSFKLEATQIYKLRTYFTCNSSKNKYSNKIKYVRFNNIVKCLQTLILDSTKKNKECK